MSNIILPNGSQPAYIAPVTLDKCAVPVERGLGVAEEVIEDLGRQLIVSVESTLKSKLTPGCDLGEAVARLEEVEKLIRSASKAPAWAQAKALWLVRESASHLESQMQHSADISLQGRVGLLAKRLDALSAQLRFLEMVTVATQRSYSALEDLSDQTAGVSDGSGEIYLNKYIAMASTLPLLGDAFKVDGEYDRKWALKEVKNIRWAIDDEGRDLIKAIRPEIKRVKEDYSKALKGLALQSKDPKQILESAVQMKEAVDHLKRIRSMMTDVKKLCVLAEQLNGPLADAGAVLRNQAKQIEQALEELGDISSMNYDAASVVDVLEQCEPEAITGYVRECFKENDFLSFKRAMRPLFLGGVDAPKEAIEALARGEGLSVEGYDYYAKNAGQMRRAYYEGRKNKSSSDSESKGSKWAWLFLGLQAMVLLRGAGSLLLGHDAAALKVQAEQMHRQAMDAVDPKLRSEVEKDASFMGTLLTDHWKGLGDNQLLSRLSPEAQDVVKGLLKGGEKPSEKQIREAHSAVINLRLAKHLNPYNHSSVGEWLAQFTSQEVQAAKTEAIAGPMLPPPKSMSELTCFLDTPGPEVNKRLLLHLGGREFGASSGLEGYDDNRMLTYVHQLMTTKLEVIEANPQFGLDRDATQKLADKMSSALSRGADFRALGPLEFAQRLDMELSELAVGDDLFWQGGWTSPDSVNGHSVVYEIVKMGEDDFTFRVYNRGEGAENHGEGMQNLKSMIWGLHEVVDIRRSNLLRPMVMQGLKELMKAPVINQKWHPSEMYYNILGRMEGKISNREVPIDQALPLIQVGICSFASLTAFMHEQLRSDRRYERTMIELEAKAAWDYWKQHGAKDAEARELLLRTAKQTIQDATQAARSERNSLSNEELDLVRNRMEEIIQGVKRIERDARRMTYQVSIETQPADLVFKAVRGTYLKRQEHQPLAPAPKYDGIDVRAHPKEVARRLRQGNIDGKPEFVRMAAQEFARGLSFDIAKSLTPQQGLELVDDLVQIASDFQWSLRPVFTAQQSRMLRLPIKDVLVPMKLLTVADSIARHFSDTTGIALPNMMQQQMAVVLYGMTAYSRVEDPALEEEIATMRDYWKGVDPQGKNKGIQITEWRNRISVQWWRGNNHGISGWNREKDDSNVTPSLFSFEWAPAGYNPYKYHYYKSSGDNEHNYFIGEDVELARLKIGAVDEFTWEKQECWGCRRYWPLVEWTIDYLKDHPESLERIFAQQPYLRNASPTAVALAALADEYIAREPGWREKTDARFSDPNNPLKKLDVARAGRIKGVLPDMFFHLWDLSFITNHVFTGVWNKFPRREEEGELRLRPTRHVSRWAKETDEGIIYYWDLSYKQYGELSGDYGQEMVWESWGPQYILPVHGLTEAHGEHEENLRSVYGRADAESIPKNREKGPGGNLQRERRSPKSRLLLENPPPVYDNEQGKLLEYHNIRGFPRETVQHLLGLSSKEDLQIEETLSYFQNNPTLLGKPEYRALFNYMLFEQGILLKEIQKRKPEELKALVESITTITSKGHQYFSNIMGNVEVAAFFLHIELKLRRYLEFAGQSEDLVEDPIPKLRQQLKEPTLSQSERTSLRFILAKSTQDPVDIVTFAIQFDLHPVDLTPFDDEIRRDLNLAFRAKLHAAFTGPDRDLLLNTVVQGVMPHHNMQTVWNVHGDFPLFQSSDGRITVDVLKGSYYELGKVPRSLPKYIQDSLKAKQLVVNPEEIKAIQTDDSTFEFTSYGIKMMVKKGTIHREIGNQWYQLQDNPLAIALDNRALIEGNHVWYSETETLILDIKTGRTLYRISYDGDKAMVHKGDNKVLSNSFRSAIEDPSWIRAWVDQKSGKLDSIELPRFDLSFTVDQEGRINCDQLPGYFQSPKQCHPYMGSIENYLVLDRIDRDQNTHQVIAMPIQQFGSVKEKSLAPIAIPMRDISSSKQAYALYDVDGMANTLMPRPIAGRFQLAMVHLWHHDYSRAAELIRGHGGQRSAYNEGELRVLNAICTLDQQNDDKTPQGRAVRMIAYAALIRNDLDFGKGSLKLKGNDYQSYLHQLEYTPELALTETEEKLIQKHFYGRLSSSTAVRMKIPNAVQELAWEDGRQEYEVFFDAINKQDGEPSLLRSKLGGPAFFSIYQAICDGEYRKGYSMLTEIELPSSLSEEQACNELLTALDMVVVSHSRREAKVLARVLAYAIVATEPLPTVEEIKQAPYTCRNQARRKNENYGDYSERLARREFFKKFKLDMIDPHPKLEFANGPMQINLREERIAREPVSTLPDRSYQHSLRLTSGPTLQGPVIENLDALITTKHVPPNKFITTALEKIFHVKTGEPLADSYLAETVRGIKEYGDSEEAKPAPQYSIRDRESLRLERESIEQKLFLMTGAESTAAIKLLGAEGANRLPTDPTLRAQRQALLASGDIALITLDDLALALINRKNGVEKVKRLNPGLSAKEIHTLLQDTVSLLIHATERRRLQAVVDAIKDLESAPAEEISNFAAQLKSASESIRQFNPAIRPEYLVFEYYIGILLQGRQVEALDKLLKRVVLEMIMGAGKTAVLTPLIAWLEANGEQLSIVVMPEGLMPEKTQELEERLGNAFSRSIDVLTFDRSSNFDEAALSRLLERLGEARIEGKLVMVSSSSLQSLLLRFIEDVLTGTEPRKIDLFRQVLAEFRNYGSITFDELDAIADVLKLQIFSMAQPGKESEREPADPQLKEATADLIKFMVSDKELAPIVAKPFTAQTHASHVKPRLIEAIFEGRVGKEDSELNRLIRAKTQVKIQSRGYIWTTETFRDSNSLLRAYLLNAEDPDAFAYVNKLESMTLKNTLAVLKHQINKMIPETFSRRVDEHYGLVQSAEVDEETKLLSKPLEKGSWEIGSEHGTAEEGINYSLQYYLAKGVPIEFVRKEVIELRDKLLADLTAGEIEHVEESPFFTKLMVLTGGKRYPLERIGDVEIEEITTRINQHDPAQIVELSMKYAVNPQLMVFPYQLRADAQMLFSMAMLARGFSGTVWNWQTFDKMFNSVELSNTEAKTLHLLQANSPQEVTIVNAQDLDGRLEQLFQGKPSVAIADVGNMFADVDSEQVARKILEKGPWKGAPYYDDNDKLMVALPGRASEPLTTAGVSKENRAPYWKQELCTGSDIPLGTNAQAVVTFGRYTMMRDLLQTVWRLRKLDKGQTVRFAVEESDRRVIVETLEKLTKRKIEQLELSHLLLYAAYIQAMRIGDDNHRSLGQQLRSQLIAEVFDIIIQPKVTPEEVVEIIVATKDLFTTITDANPYNRYGIRESMQTARQVVEAELAEVLKSKPMQALQRYCDVSAIEKRLRATVEMMLPRMTKLLTSPVDTGIHLKVKTKTKTKTKTQTQTQTQTKTKTQVQLRAAVHKNKPELPFETLHWTEEALFSPNILQPASSPLIRNATVDNLVPSQVRVADALGYYHPIAKIFDPRLTTTLNRMPIYTPNNPEKRINFVPYDEYEDPVTNHVLLIENKGEIRLMLLDQDDASDIQALLQQGRHPSTAPNLSLINLVTDKVWRQSGAQIPQSADVHGLKAQAKLVNGMLSYTDEEKKALLHFLEGKDVQAIREWFTQIVIGNRQQSLERFLNSDLEQVFQKAMRLANN